MRRFGLGVRGALRLATIAILFAIVMSVMSGCVGGAENNPLPDAGGRDSAFAFDAQTIADANGAVVVDAAIDAVAPDGASPLDAGSGARSASATVSGGTVSRSARYTLIGTVGQSPGGNGTSRSPKFQLSGGVVGASQKP